MTSKQCFSAARALSPQPRNSSCGCACSCSNEFVAMEKILGQMKQKSEIRNPKSERNPKAEIRSACSDIDSRHGSPFGIRNSNFLRISAFGVRISAALLLVAALLPACSRKSVGPNVLARVGNHEITIQDFEREMQWYEKSRRPMPEREALLEQMISRELRLQKARAA